MCSWNEWRPIRFTCCRFDELEPRMSEAIDIHARTVNAAATADLRLASRAWQFPLEVQG